MARRRTRRRLRRRARGTSSGKRPGLRQPTIKEALEIAKLFAGTSVGKEMVKYVNQKILNKTPSTAPPIRMKARRRGISYGGTVNVKADAERWTRTYYKQKVTNLQQKRINKRFRSDNASKVVYENDYPITETVPQQLNTCKWIWFCHNDLTFVRSAWSHFTPPAAEYTNLGNPVVAGNSLAPIANKEQAIYFNKIRSIYEIFNPTNYDMNVTIYDIVCKEDHVRPIQTDMTKALVSFEENMGTDVINNNSNPIALMYHGSQGVEDPNGGWQVGRDNTGESIYDIQFKPSTSYPFNLTWTIVGKKNIRLQPGASFNHKFTYKCKNLMQRGYYGYQYMEHLNAGQNQVHTNTNTPVKGFTCGSLFKVWGQISGSTESGLVGLDETPTQTIPKGVVNLSGRIMIKEFYKLEYYNCAPKYSYKMVNTTSTWRPEDEEELTIPTVIDMQPIQDELPDNDQGTAD